MLTLFDYYRSSASYRVRIALNIKALDYQIETVHLLNNGGEQSSEFYRKINAHCLVPTLQDGNHYITQSLAIIEYLDETHPMPALLPATPLERARVRAFALSIAADIHPLNNLRVTKYLTSEFQMTEDQKRSWMHHWINKGLSALETQLTASKHTMDFCFGDQPTLADVCLIPQLYNAKRFGADITQFPTLHRIDNNCESLPSFTKAYPMEPVPA